MLNAELEQLRKGETTLDLGERSLNDEDVEPLAESLKENKSLTSLNLFGNSLSMSGTHFDLSDTLEVNTTLTTLNLGKNRISQGGSARLATALKVNKTLTRLNLHGNPIGSVSAVYLAEALEVNTTLTSIDLSNTAIGDTGVAHFADALKVNTSLTKLILNAISMSDGGAKYFAGKLKDNKTLTSFHFRGTKITAVGAGHLDELVLSNKNIIEADYPSKSQAVITELAKRAKAALEAANCKKSAFTAKCIIAGLAVGGGTGELLRYYTSLASTYLPNNPIVRYTIPVITAVIFGAAAYCYAKRTQDATISI